MTPIENLQKLQDEANQLQNELAADYGITDLPPVEIQTLKVAKKLCTIQIKSV